MLADTRFDRRIKIIWDRHYAGESAGDYMAALAPMVEKAARSGSFVVVSDVADLDGTDTTTADADARETEAINAALRAKYPDHYLDMTAPLADPATRTDGLHLTATGEAAVAETIAGYVRQHGW
jgi:lysophospholipase L1-like esterase